MRTAAVILLLTVATGWAQWPSPSKPFQSYDRGNQALSGAVERLTVSVGPQAWTNYMTTNLWASYFSQAAKLKASKAMFKAAVDAGGWVRPATNWTPESSETVTASNLLAWIGAPPSWWTNTPYVNIAAHSNGWRFLPAVASNVVWRGQYPLISQTNSIEWFYTGTGATWQAAYDDAVAAVSFPVAITTNVYLGEYSVAYKIDDTGRYTAWLLVNAASLYIECDSTNYERGVSVFNLIPYDSSLLFDAQGCSVSTQAFQSAHTETVEAGGYYSGYFSLIPGGYTYPPNYAPEPEVGYGVGWSLLGSPNIEWATPIRYNATTNGFKWFR